jgi:hypothetical protein
MKTYITILILVAAFFAKSSAQPIKNDPAEEFSVQSVGKSLEVVLCDDKVAFTTLTNVELPFILRNVGETRMKGLGLISRLSVVWDGKDYRPNGKRLIGYFGTGEIFPENCIRTSIDLWAYVPEEKLKPGKHTVSLKVADAASNQLTVFIR